MQPYSDHTNLIAALSNGEQLAFKHLYIEYYDDLCFYANRILNDMDEAHDVVQFVMAKMWENKTQLSHINDIKPYLYRSVHNNCLNKIKKAKNFANYQDETWHQIKEIELDGHEELKAEELGEKINASIEKLTPQCKKVFMMSRFEYKSYKEIAEELQIGVKAVEGNISRALKVLREELVEFFPLFIILSSFLM